MVLFPLWKLKVLLSLNHKPKTLIFEKFAQLEASTPYIDCSTMPPQYPAITILIEVFPAASASLMTILGWVL